MSLEFSQVAKHLPIETPGFTIARVDGSGTKAGPCTRAQPKWDPPAATIGLIGLFCAERRWLVHKAEYDLARIMVESDAPARETRLAMQLDLNPAVAFRASAFLALNVLVVVVVPIFQVNYFAIGFFAKEGLNAEPPQEADRKPAPKAMSDVYAGLPKHSPSVVSSSEVSISRLLVEKRNAAPAQAQPPVHDQRELERQAEWRKGEIRKPQPQPEPAAPMESKVTVPAEPVPAAPASPVALEVVEKQRVAAGTLQPAPELLVEDAPQTELLNLNQHIPAGQVADAMVSAEKQLTPAAPMLEAAAEMVPIASQPPTALKNLDERLVLDKKS